jgi:YD repeat-containing protein
LAADDKDRIATVFSIETRGAVMTPKITYQAEDNAAYIQLSQGEVLESAEVAPDVVFDYDAEGRIVGIELLDARAQLSPELLIEAA